MLEENDRMHELSIAMEIITIVENEIAKHNLRGVAEINIRLGALTGVDPEALSFGFEAATIDTPLAGTKLDIKRIPVKGKCRSCEQAFSVNDFIFRCPYCDSADIEVIQGEELNIDYLVET